MRNSQMNSNSQLSYFEAPPYFSTARFLFNFLENDCECEISRQYLCSICYCEVRAFIKEPASSFISRFSSPSSFDLLRSSFNLLSSFFDLLIRIRASSLKCLTCLWVDLLLRLVSLTSSANSNVDELLLPRTCQPPFAPTPDLYSSIL